MSKPELLYTRFSVHCAHNIPFFCNYGPQGLTDHCHVDFYEFIIVASGSYSHIYNNEETICKTGTLIFIKPGQIHSLTALSQNSCHYSFGVREAFFRAFCMKHMHNADNILQTPFVMKKTANGIQFGYLSQLASAIVYSISAELLPVAEQLLSNLLFACFEPLPNKAANPSKVYAVDLHRRLSNFEALDMDISQIYTQYPLSQTALINDFKKLTGYTIVQYRTMKRMEYAASLLVGTNYSVTDIINMLNLSSLGYFSKQFKKQFGMTPKQYQLENCSQQKTNKSTDA